MQALQQRTLPLAPPKAAAPLQRGTARMAPLPHDVAAPPESLQIPVQSRLGWWFLVAALLLLVLGLLGFLARAMMGGEAGGTILRESPTSAVQA